MTMTDRIESLLGGTGRGANPRGTNRGRGTRCFWAILSLVFIAVSFLCAGCDDEAKTSREKEAAAMEEAIRQANEINRDLSFEQPKLGEEDAYKEKIEKCLTALNRIDTSQCPLRFQHFFKQYLQSVDGLYSLLGSETREKKGYDARCEKRKDSFSQINKAKDNVNFIALDYGVTVQMGEAAPGDEKGAPPTEDKTPSSVENGANKTLIPNELPKEVLEPVKDAVAEAVDHYLDRGKFASKDDVRAVQTLTWIITGVFGLLGIIILCLLILIFVPLKPMLNKKKYEAERDQYFISILKDMGSQIESQMTGLQSELKKERNELIELRQALAEKERALEMQDTVSKQLDAVTKERNELMLELAKSCYQHGAFSECIRHLENAKRLGLKEAERLFSCYLDDSKDFRDAVEVYQFLEKKPRPS